MIKLRIFIIDSYDLYLYVYTYINFIYYWIKFVIDSINLDLSVIIFIVMGYCKKKLLFKLFGLLILLLLRS
jgi:hypothetical protein